MRHIPLPEEGDYAPYFNRYISLVVNEDILLLLVNQMKEVDKTFIRVKEGAENYRYEENKWSLKELLLHIVDAERVFAYRALSFLRGDEIPLPGFDQDIYAANVTVEDRPLKSIIDEFKLVRKSIIPLFHFATDEQVQNIGNADGKDMKVSAIPYIIAGHYKHHENIVKERYSKAFA